MNASPVTLVQFPRHLGVPNASPFCVKVELWLRKAGVNYTIEEQVMPMSAPKKKIPYIRDGGRAIGDSTFIIDHLTKTRGIDLDDGLSAVEKARDEALVALIEERIYWQMVYDRWLGDGWGQISDAFFGMQPPVIRQAFKAFAVRAVKRQLWEQGISRHSKDEVYGMAKRDVAALAEIVGDGPYVHGDTFRTIDCTVYGTVINMTDNTLETPFTEMGRAHDNLVAYARRITDAFFSDLK